MIKAMLFDIDGVLIHHKKRFSTSLLGHQYEGLDDIVKEFHEGKINQDCDRGSKDPLKEIEPYLKMIGWQCGAERYLEIRYSFEKQFIDHAMIETIGKTREQGIKTYIGSNQNYHRKDYLMKEMNISANFDDWFFSCDLGYIKPEKEYWEKTMDRINRNERAISAKEVLFLDDRLENVKSAERYGMSVRQIKERQDVMETIRHVELMQ